MKASIDEDRCLASITPKRATGWKEHGKLVVLLEDGQPKQLEAHDLDGRIVSSRPAPKNKSEARALMKELTCFLGGVVATLDEASPPTEGAGTATFAVLVPVVVDERADLAAFCKAPEASAAGMVERQKARLTFDQLEQRLTSKRWRAWLFDLIDEHERTSGGDRLNLHWTKADELGVAVRQAGLTGTCWFETQLRSPTE